MKDFCPVSTLKFLVSGHLGLFQQVPAEMDLCLAALVSTPRRSYSEELGSSPY